MQVGISIESIACGKDALKGNVLVIIWSLYTAIYFNKKSDV